MGKDPYLVNIYLKIHNKKNLTMNDLAYLAKYSPECFEKTCKNVVYNIPETKPIMESPSSLSANNELKSEAVEPQPEVLEKQSESLQKQSESADSKSIETVLENLKRLEAKDFPIENVDANEVKSLLGNLFMELLFPHNDKDTFMDMTKKHHSFDKKA